MPVEDADIDVESAVDAFLSDDGAETESVDVVTTDTDSGAASVDGDDDPVQDGEDRSRSTDGSDVQDGSDDDDHDSDAETREPSELDKAVESGDVRKFISALGDKAQTLLGGKAHKALRLKAEELTSQEKRIHNAGNALKAKFGDQVAARKEWSKGNVDAFIDFVEKTTGASWAECEEAVHAAQSGRESRIQAKSQEEAEAQAAREAAQKDNEQRLRTLITETVKGSDAKLLEADPEIVEDVFRIMQSGWRRGLDTPAKALAALKKRLVAMSGILSPAPAKERTTPPRRRSLPPPRVPQSRGEPPQDVDDMVSAFLREEGWHGR